MKYLNLKVSKRMKGMAVLIKHVNQLYKLFKVSLSEWKY